MAEVTVNPVGAPDAPAYDVSLNHPSSWRTLMYVTGLHCSPTRTQKTDPARGDHVSVCRTKIAIRSSEMSYLEPNCALWEVLGRRGVTSPDHTGYTGLVGTA